MNFKKKEEEKRLVNISDRNYARKAKFRLTEGCMSLIKLKWS